MTYKFLFLILVPAPGLQIAPEKVLYGYFCRERFPLRLPAGSEKKEAEFSSSEDKYGFAWFPFPLCAVLKTDPGRNSVYLFLYFYSCWKGREKQIHLRVHGGKKKLYISLRCPALFCFAKLQVVSHCLISNTLAAGF